MERLPHEHLSLYELTLLVSDRTFHGPPPDVSDSDTKELEDHLLSCEECRKLLEREQSLFLLSMRRQPKDVFQVGPNCVSEQGWAEIVAGQHSAEETQRQLEHTLNCAHCAALLKRSAEQFADDATDEEKRIIDNLRSADPNWQRALALQLRQLSSSENPNQTEKKTWHKGFLIRLMFGAASATVLLSVAWWFAYGRADRNVNRLLSEAYSTQRTTVLRMYGARYAPVEALRGTGVSEVQPPTTLLEAEILIAKHLRSRPDAPFWLDARGRAELMNDRYGSALAVLERAYRYAPEDPKIRIDLASAYFLRGDELKRSEDYGRAADLLGQVLSKDPRNAVARFNRAIVSERLHLYEQAIADWKQYLELDPSSPWSEEARQHLKDLHAQINRHQENMERALVGPAEFVALVHDHRPGSHQDVDTRADRYFELALREWIPLAFSNPTTSDSVAAHAALDDLAKILAQRHGDFWLTDFLRELQRNPLSRTGLPQLVDAVKHNETSDYDNARQSAVDAASAFRAARMSSGEIMARFEASYADQLKYQISNCLTEARARGDPHSTDRYPWLQAQLALEMAACTDWNDEAAPKFSSEALSLAELHHYPSLALRATTFLATLYEDHGDASSAWRYASDGLAQFWEGDYPSMRGYSLYAGLDYVAEDEKEWSFDVQILEEAATLLGDDPDLEMRAMQRYRLANALVMTGDYSSAEHDFQEAETLFSRSGEGTRKNNLEFETQIGLAKLELLRFHPGRTIRRLEPLKATAEQSPDPNLMFDYFRNLGLAYFAVGDPDQARASLAVAVTLAERSLQTNRDERERLIWCRKSDEVYRALVQINSFGFPKDAFSEWEWFKGASLRGGVSPSVLDPRKTVSVDPASAPALSFLPPADTVIVSYALLPQGLLAWSYSRDGVTQHHLGLSKLDLDRLAHKFADHCSRPDSDANILKAESQELYEKLLAPMELSLRPFTHLVIEPDQILWMIPFEALLDRNGVYLGDRYAISMSPGLDYLSLTPSRQRVSEQSRIVIVADPEISGRAPLDDAEKEAKGIAQQFRYNTLLLKSDADYGRVAEQIEDADIFHFSGHATATPDGVGLVFGNSVMDVSKIRVSKFLHLKLAVLSACDTANGTSAVFDDRDSLARLLVGAGVPDVVASRWMADSRATATLMRVFYAQLVSGKGVSSALREASRKLRGNQEFLHPFYWANFSAFGKS